MAKFVSITEWYMDKKGKVDLSEKNIAHLLAARDVYNECLDLLGKWGPIVTSAVNKQNPNRLDVLYYDILQRLNKSIYDLTLLPPQSCNIISTRLNLRSIFADLIVALSLLSRDKTLAEAICYAFDLEGTKKLIQHFELEKELFGFCPRPPVKPESVEKILLKLAEGKDKAQSKMVSGGANKGMTTIKSLAEGIKASTNPDIPSYLYNILFSPYLFLSQTEHYSVVNRQHSYFDHDEIFFFEIYSKKIKYALQCFIDAVAKYFNIS